MKNIFKEYYKLTKPGIVYGNIFTTVAALFFAAPWHHGFTLASGCELFLATVVGVGFVIASACVFNNYLDRDMDAKMERTASRALVLGTISAENALAYSTLLGLVGIALLYARVNPLTAGIAFFGFIFYVIVYGIAKRGSSWGAVVGSVSGAVPIVLGYTAVTNHLDAAALVLFAVLVIWQMPHFYGIALYRLDEYKAAGIPVLPAEKGVRTTKVHILWYIVAYLVATVLLTPFVPAGIATYVYLLSVLGFGFVWLWLAIKGFKIPPEQDALWAKKVFLFSLIILVSFSVTIAVVPLLP